MRFKVIINDVEARMNNNEQTTLVKQWINDAQDEIQAYFDYPFLLSEDWIQTVAEYSTGTVSVTNGSTTVTGSGTTFTSAMTGRKIRVSGDSEYYTVTYVGATSLTLDRNYEGTTDSGLSYSIFKDIYRVRGDVNKLKIFRNLGYQLAMEYASNTDFDLARPAVTIASQPRVVIIKGRDTSTETTGTVSGTAAAYIITGAGTSWSSVDGLTKGVKIRVGNYTYTIKSVDSDTQVTTYEPLAETIAALTTYVINLNNILVQFYPPPTSSIGIPYKFYRQLPPLVNDWDESEIPEKYHRLLVEGACKRAFIHSYDQTKYQLAKAEFNEGLLIMKADFRMTKDQVNVMKSDDYNIARNVYRIPDSFGSLS